MFTSQRPSQTTNNDNAIKKNKMLNDKAILLMALSTTVIA